MTRRSGAAEALVEQPGRACRGTGFGGRRGQFGHPERSARGLAPPPHCPVPVEHVTIATGRSPGRTAARRAALLDRTLVWNQRHLMIVLHEYEDFCNTHRPRRALKQAAPLRQLPDGITDLDQFRVQRRDRAGA